MTLNFLRNWIGRVKGYGGCLHCGDTWNWKGKYFIPYRDGAQMFPLCRECFEKLDAKTIIDYCKKLIEDWKRERKIHHDMLDGRLLGFDEKQAIRAIKDYVREVKKKWVKHPGIERVTSEHWKNAKWDGARKLTR